MFDDYRAKTDTPVNVPLLQPAQVILDKFTGENERWPAQHDLPACKQSGGKPKFEDPRRNKL